MEMFTLDWGRSWFLRLIGRNQLVRSSDRLETLVATLAAIAVFVAVPIAAAFGTSVKEARSSVYAQQALSRHETSATAVESAAVHPQMYTQTFDVRARWAVAGTVHVGTVSVPGMVNAGDQFRIWTDWSGNYTKAPTPTSEAATQATGWAALLWMAVVGAAVAAVYGLHQRLERTRYSEWDRELDSLAGNDGGRATQ
jgi:hypothetical protein